MEPANLIVIMSDEHDPRYLGAAGDDFVHTPNLDRLAASGTRFTSACTPSPICVPARAAFATGEHVHQIGYWDNAMGYDGAISGWGHALQQAGKPVESIGKLHYRSDADRVGFSEYHAVGSPSAGFMVRRGDWKYHYYVDYPPELFNLAEEPEELIGRGTDPAYARVRKDMHEALLGVCDPLEVEQRAKRDQADLIAAWGGRDRALTIGAPAATPAPEQD